MKNNWGEGIITMKQYTKPTATVVELAVKENIAALPSAIAGNGNVSELVVNGQNLILTTYNLATQSTSKADM